MLAALVVSNYFRDISNERADAISLLVRIKSLAGTLSEIELDWIGQEPLEFEGLPLSLLLCAKASFTFIARSCVVTTREAVSPILSVRGRSHEIQ